MILKNKNFFIALFAILTVSFYDSKIQAAPTNSLEKIEVSASKNISNNSKSSKSTSSDSSKLDYSSSSQVVFCVNREFIFEQSKIANSIKKEMKDFENRIIAELKPMAEKFEELRTQYEEKAKSLKRDALVAEEEKIGQLTQEIQMKQMESQDAYKREEMRLTKEFLNSLNDACKEFLLKDENSNVLLYPVDGGMYTHKKYDATASILEIMDSKFDKVSSKSAKKETEQKKK